MLEVLLVKLLKIKIKMDVLYNIYNATKSKSQWMFSTMLQNRSQNGCSLQYLSLYLHFSFLYLCVYLTMQIMFIHPQMSNFQDLAEESQLDSKLLVLVKYMIPVVILE